MVKCNNCDFDVGDSAFCPNCGTKVELKISKSSCPNCGFDAEDSAFCPNCGTKLEEGSSKSFCPNCGEDVGDSAFCPSCGAKIKGEQINSIDNAQSSSESNDLIDDVFEVDDKVSNKFGNLLGKSKAMNVVLDKTASFSYKNKTMHVDKGMNRKYYEKVEPVFLEVCDSIEDEFVKAILIYQRSMMGSSGSIIGAVASQIFTPTKDLSHEGAIKFYQDMVNEIVAEINQEKAKGTFDEEKFYKKKVKENAINSVSVLGFSKSLKSFKNNQK